MRTRRIGFLVPATLLLLACTISAVTSGNPSAPGANPPAAAPPAEVAPPAAGAPTVAPTVALPPTACSPLLTANSAVNVRAGPGTVYTEVGALTMSQTAPIDGQNAEGTWWRIVYPAAPGGHGWVAASVSTATCVTGVAAVVPPATPTVVIPIGVTSVTVSVDPKTIGVPGCMGPIQQSTVVATITVNGPYDLKYHFESDQLGGLGNHNLSFAGAGSKDVSEKFTPLLTPGTYWVRLYIDGVDLGGMDNQAKYKITC